MKNFLNPGGTKQSYTWVAGGTHEPLSTGCTTAPQGQPLDLMIRGVTVGQHKVNVHVIPNAKEFKLVSWDRSDNTLKVKVKSKPEGGKANRDLITNLKKVFKCNLKILHGERYRDKVILFDCSELEFNEIVEKLKQNG